METTKVVELLEGIFETTPADSIQLTGTSDPLRVCHGSENAVSIYKEEIAAIKLKRGFSYTVLCAYLDENPALLIGVRLTTDFEGPLDVVLNIQDKSINVFEYNWKQFGEDFKKNPEMLKSDTAELWKKYRSEAKNLAEVADIGHFCKQKLENLNKLMNCF